MSCSSVAFFISGARTQTKDGDEPEPEGTAAQHDPEEDRPGDQEGGKAVQHPQAALFQQDSLQVIFFEVSILPFSQFLDLLFSQARERDHGGI